MIYGIQLDFDEQGEPPRVFIADNHGRGTCVVEVFEEPTCTDGDWSRDDDDWQPGPMARLILDALNRSIY